jgi:hypothetical protein
MYVFLNNPSELTFWITYIFLLYLSISLISSFIYFLLEDIPLCLEYINTNKICMYLIENNNVLISLVATSFGHHDHREASVTQKLKGWLHVVYKNVKLCGIPFRS